MEDEVPQGSAKVLRLPNKNWSYDENAEIILIVKFTLHYERRFNRKRI